MSESTQANPESKEDDMASYMAFLESVSENVRTWPKGKGAIWLRYIRYDN